MIIMIKKWWESLISIFKKESQSEKELREKIENIESDDPFIYK